MEREFTVIVERDPESGWLVGSVVGLPGCFTTAPDEQALRSAILEAIDLYVEVREVDELLPEFIGTLKVRAAVPSAA